MQLDYSFEKKSQLSSLLLALGYLRLDRRFNDFNRGDVQFGESGDLLQFLSRWQRQYARGTLDLDLVINSLGRDRLFAEEGRYPQETYEQDKKSWLAGISWAGRPVNLKFSWLQEWEQRRPMVMDAGKNLKDVDGQGFFPFEKWGEFRATTLALRADKKIAATWLGKKTEIEPYLDLSAVFPLGRRSRPDRTTRSFSPAIPIWSTCGRGAATTATSGATARAGRGCAWI